jgi:hypothetical protein
MDQLWRAKEGIGVVVLFEGTNERKEIGAGNAWHSTRFHYAVSSVACLLHRLSKTELRITNGHKVTRLISERLSLRNLLIIRHSFSFSFSAHFDGL